MPSPPTLVRAALLREDLQPHHPGDGALGHHCVVQGDVVIHRTARPAARTRPASSGIPRWSGPSAPGPAAGPARSTSSSDMKPRLPRFTPSTGTLCSATRTGQVQDGAVAAEGDQQVRLADLLLSRGCMDRPSSSPYPSRWKGRQTHGLQIPRLSSISRDLSAHFQFTVPVRIGTKDHAFLVSCPLTSVLQLAVGRLHDRRQIEAAGAAPSPLTQDSPDIRYSPPVPGWENK